MATPNIVPRENKEGGLGTADKGWGKLFIENAAAGGTAAATISNLDVDKVALDINASNTTENVLDISANSLTTAGSKSAIFIDTANSVYPIRVDQDITETNNFAMGGGVYSNVIKAVNTASGQTASIIGLRSIAKDTGTNVGIVAVNGLKVESHMTSAAGTTVLSGIHNVVTGASDDTVGIRSHVVNGAKDLQFSSSVNITDTFDISTTTNGATTLKTTDADAELAHFEVDADGDITLDANGDIKLEPAAGSNILLDGTIAVDAGVVTGATSIQLQGSPDDTCTIATVSHGATSLTTVDDGGAAAHLTVVADGNVDVDGLVITLDAATSIELEGPTNVTGALASSTSMTVGSTVITDDSLVMTPSAGDSFSIVSGTNGQSSIRTNDAAGTAAHLTLAVDGSLIQDCAAWDVNSAGNTTINGTATSIDSTTLSIDSTDTTNLTMTANDSGGKTMTIDAINSGSGAAFIAIGHTGGTNVSLGSTTSTTSVGGALSATGISTLAGGVVYGAETKDQGAATLAIPVTFIEIDGTKGYTLADAATAGSIKHVTVKTVANSPVGVLTPNATAGAWSTATFNTVGQTLTLLWDGAGWAIMARGAGVAAAANAVAGLPVIA